MLLQEGGYTVILQQRQPLAEISEEKNRSKVTPKKNGEAAKPVEKEKPTEEEKVARDKHRGAGRIYMAHLDHRDRVPG
mgnify:CR=1 FL=1